MFLCFSNMFPVPKIVLLFRLMIVVLCCDFVSYSSFCFLILLLFLRILLFLMLFCFASSTVGPKFL